MAVIPRVLTAARLSTIGRLRIGKRQLVGLAIIAVLLGLFLLLNRVPKLDIAREDLAAAGGGVPGRCFQGFCVEYADDAGFFTRWWNFTLTYLRLVAVGMGFAFLVAGATEVFLFPKRIVPAFSTGGFKGALRGLFVGTPMTLCSACIVPISSAFRRRGAGVEATIGIAQGSSTLNLPAIVMAVTVFAPILAGSRIALAVLGGLMIGPLVAQVASMRNRRGRIDATEGVALDDSGPSTWREVLIEGLMDWAKASTRYLLRLGPLMIAAGLVSGFVVQWLSPDLVERFLGNDVAGIAVAATFGILINVPLLFEIPLVAALLLVGMGTAPAATLLFTAAAAGPFTFWGLAKVLPKRAIVVFGAATWALGALGGLAVLGLDPLTTDPPLAGMQVRPGVAKRADSTLDDSKVTPVPAGATVFADVTDAAGLVYIQDTLRPNGSCLLGSMCAAERQTGGVAAADYDNDGFIDLYVTRLNAPDILFRNLGNGRFEDRTREAGLHEFDLRSNGAVWFDSDNDGDLDLYVTTVADTRFYMFVNDGRGRFTEEAVGRGAAVNSAYQHIGYSVAVGDYDRDGWLDLHINEWGSSLLLDGLPSHARLLRNRGPAAPGHFEDVTVEAGVALEDVQSQLDRDPISPSLGPPKGPFAFASTFVDLDSDGWPDLAIASDNGHSRLFWNNGDGTFTDGTLSAKVGTDKSGMGSTFGDYDGDGDLDWFVTAIYAEFDLCEGKHCDIRKATGNRLYRNEGGRLFSDVTDVAGVRNGGWGWGAVFLDYDNDGDLDLAMVGGMHHSDDLSESELDYPRLWQNDGNGSMTEIARGVGLGQRSAAKGLIALDYDDDGDLDLFVVNNAGSPSLYRNDGGNTNSWLRIRLVDDKSNSTPIGATIEVTPKTGGRSQIRQMGVSSHFLGQSELVAHFGLGAHESTVDTVTITWPVSGEVIVLRDVPARATVIVRAGEAGYSVAEPPS